MRLVDVGALSNNTTKDRKFTDEDKHTNTSATNNNKKSLDICVCVCLSVARVARFPMYFPWEHTANEARATR